MESAKNRNFQPWIYEYEISLMRNHIYGCTVNKKYYLEVKRRLREAIRQTLPKWWQLAKPDDSRS